MKQRGFALIAVVSVVAVLVIVGGVGFVMYNNFAAPKAADTHNHSSSPSEHDMKTMQSVSSTKDLDQATESLDDPSFDDDGQSDIDKEAAQF